MKNESDPTKNWFFWTLKLIFIHSKRYSLIWVNESFHSSHHQQKTYRSVRNYFLEFGMPWRQRPSYSSDDLSLEVPQIGVLTIASLCPLCHFITWSIASLKEELYITREKHSRMLSFSYFSLIKSWLPKFRRNGDKINHKLRMAVPIILLKNVVIPTVKST